MALPACMPRLHLQELLSLIQTNYVEIMSSPKCAVHVRLEEMRRYASVFVIAVVSFVTQRPKRTLVCQVGSV